MDYQLSQTGQEVQEILNQAPDVIAASALDTLDATGMYYTTDDNGKVSGIVLCTAEIKDGATVYVQSYLHDGVVELRAGSSLPLTGQWVNLAQMQIDALNTVVSNKVSKRTGYDLSQNDFTDYYKGSIESLMRNVASLSQNKQDKITDLDAIRSGASAGSTAVQPAALTPIQNAIDDIEAVIPSEASAQNQLADKNYVDNHSSDVDDALSTTSENPVQNKVVTNALNGKQATISDLSEIRSGAAAGATAVQPATMDSALAEKQDTIDDLSTIRSGASAGATAVQPAAMNTALAAKQDTLTFDNAPTANSNNPVKSGGVKTAIDAKQDTISDLSTIRSGAAAGATAYQKPSTGIPKTDLASAVQTSLGKADTAVQPATMDSALAEKQDTISTVNVTVDNNTGTPSGSASVSGSTLSLSLQNLKGATGAQGPQGIQGVQGPQGPKGDTGVTGDASSLAIIHGIDGTTSYQTNDVAGADAVQALLNDIEGGFYY